MTSPEDLTRLIEDATFDFTMGDNAVALEKLDAALRLDEASFEAWHAKAEIHYEDEDFDAALKAAQRAHSIKPDDLLINTSLSRIWIAKGDKEQAEHFGAKAKMLGWKAQLTNPDANDSDTDLA